MTDIKPALTAEEWEGKEIALDGTPGWQNRYGEEANPSGRRHAVAALALYGQSFGFTRGDVAALRHDAKIVGEWRWAAANTHGGGDRTGFMNDLAARIEALLPPETPS